MANLFDQSGLKNISKHLSKVKDIDFDDLFDNKFMAENTKFKTIKEFLNACGIKSADDIEDKLGDLNDFVSANTKFDSWKDMLKSAGAGNIAKKLGL